MLPLIEPGKKLKAADYIRQLGPFEPHRLPLDEMEYTTMPQVMKKLKTGLNNDRSFEDTGQFSYKRIILVFLYSFLHLLSLLKKVDAKSFIYGNIILGLVNKKIKIEQNRLYESSSIKR